MNKNWVQSPPRKENIVVDIEFCRKSGCDYYFGSLDDCMYGDRDIPKDYLKMCKTSRYQVYLIEKENKNESQRIN